MKIFFICTVFFIYALPFCSSGQANYREVSGKFMQFYNAEKSDSIYNLYSADLQEKLSADKTKAVIEGLHIQFGDLKSLIFLKAADGYQIYKASFQQQIKCLLLELNDQNQINGYRIIDYHPENYPSEKSNP